MTGSIRKTGTYYDDVVTQPAPVAVPASGEPVRPWRILRGLTISGFLLALPGGLLPVWGYHLGGDLGTAANYFAALGAGLTAGAVLGLRLHRTYPVQRVLGGGCIAGALSLLLLAFVPPPASTWLQAAALLLTGLAAGLINTAVFEALAPAWESDPAGSILQGGIFFGLGSVVSAWLLSKCIDSMDAPRYFALTALVSAVSGVMFLRVPLTRHSRVWQPMSSAVKDLRSVLAILFALLLFFQFASEWSLAGWLPVFLIDRLGLSPETALLLLALYWLALTAGRVGVARLLGRVRHGRLLGISAFCALFGCICLVAADTRAGVVIGILLTGAGFSAIYPLASERIATRFAFYHPGYFNGIFTFAMLGGILAPFLVGHLAAVLGLRVIPLAAIVGSCAVFVLVFLVWLGRKVSGS